MIDITGVDLKKFVQKVYDLSRPQGLGMMHYTPAPMSEKEAEEIVGQKPFGNIILSMDYVRGRACKVTVRREGGRLLINDTWYDHTDMQLRELLKEFGISASPSSGHGAACICVDCQRWRDA